MKQATLNLKDLGYPVEGGKLECILSDYPFDREGISWKRPAVLIIPGGAYMSVSKREGEHVGHYFLAGGFQVFVLTYLVQPDGVRYPEQLIEVGCAVDHIKKHAEEYHINADEVFVVGFSAGGHLAANFALDYTNVSQKAGVPLDCSIKGLGLGYPVINPSGHFNSFENLLCGYTDEAKEMLLEELSLEKRVTEQTVPTFIWTTAEDEAVDPRNSIVFAEALATKRVPFELHVYPHGYHGGATVDNEVSFDKRLFGNAGNWLKDCMDFFRLYTQEKY